MQALNSYYYHARKVGMSYIRMFLPYVSSVGMPIMIVNKTINEAISEWNIHNTDIAFCKIALANGSSRSQKPLKFPLVAR